ncbi:Amylo-alpha-16-glucosidase [Beutenbergia cavernae DSM 12333]|uniref:Amylo-alpha-16-glucosidase n=1 Tax=Beutenbergia cavernae (strain ATCC BAA-8 / DSM 12333 / CCUG 43141 / JCM 11478 / NBRC 16432 / NCIMB 13614 / HKI 0122) TaxID=471853 RepID=C5C5M1_BEUC1|nr:glycogen debranching N-terminal domain-containing protein [Beutenbergia cavernae]ACQ80212.1 Amylo-alpha-16-glucosidase [Beutenbergia cavernae DSM 12333]
MATQVGTPRQPFLDSLVVALAAPTQAWSGADGQIRHGGAHGVFHGDVRALARAELLVAGEEPEVIAAGPQGRGRVHVVALARGIDAAGADPTVRLDRVRRVEPGAVREDITVTCAVPGTARGRLEIVLGSDLADMDAVKAGRTPALLPVHADGDRLTWAAAGVSVAVEAPGAVVDARDLAAPRIAWDVEVTQRAPVTLSWTLTATDSAAVVVPARGPVPWSAPTLEADDHRLAPWLERSLEDLASLRMATTELPDDEFLAAGAPWFFTLFGRDSLWAARMLLPLGTGLARGTLRTLAAGRGRREDAATGEQPGKVLHEVRRAGIGIDDGARLPPVYFGTIDATPLWIVLLRDAWRWGLPADDVAELLPALEDTLGWLDAQVSDSDGVAGFLRYEDRTGAGLANQGWKDSGDSVQWRSGELAQPPIALAEVQAYAYEAALAGAELLAAFDRPGADAWRDWADRLARRFRSAFWVTVDGERYPAIALDATGSAVDSLTSNLGHLLGTGLLDADEERVVASHLTDPRLDSGYGLRTLAAGSGGYWPLRYHGGAVWPHDTAIAVRGLARAGFAAEAEHLASGLVRAAPDLDYRLPELWSGDAAGTVPTVVPYPAACRPQAWSAAGAVAVLQSVLGIEADVPAGVVRVRARPGPLGALAWGGLRAGNGVLDVARAADGRVTARAEGDGVEVRVE